MFSEAKCCKEKTRLLISLIEFCVRRLFSARAYKSHFRVCGSTWENLISSYICAHVEKDASAFATAVQSAPEEKADKFYTYN